MPNTIVDRADDVTPNSYTITEKVLGRGSFAIVKEAVCKADGKIVAAKVTNLRYNNDVHQREVEVLSSLAHQNIVKFHMSDVFYRCGTIFMDLLPGPNFYEAFVQQKLCLDHSEILEMMLRLVGAVEHMHSKGFAHRDLKPENIALSGREPIIFDFGLSYIPHKDKDLKSCVGSPLYMAPEVLLSTGYDPYLIDIWGLGLVLYTMLFKDIPNSDVRDLGQLQDKMASSAKFEYPSRVSEPLAKILDGVLAFDPAERWSLVQIREEIEALL